MGLGPGRTPACGRAGTGGRQGLPAGREVVLDLGPGPPTAPKANRRGAGPAQGAGAPPRGRVEVAAQGGAPGACRALGRGLGGAAGGRRRGAGGCPGRYTGGALGWACGREPSSGKLSLAAPGGRWGPNPPHGGRAAAASSVGTRQHCGGWVLGRPRAPLGLGGLCLSPREDGVRAPPRRPASLPAGRGGCSPPRPGTGHGDPGGARALPCTSRSKGGWSGGWEPSGTWASQGP